MNDKGETEIVYCPYCNSNDTWPERDRPLNSVQWFCAHCGFDFEVEES